MIGINKPEQLLVSKLGVTNVSVNLFDWFEY